MNATLYILAGFAGGWGARGILTDVVYRLAMRVLTSSIGRAKVLAAVAVILAKEKGQE